MKRSIFNFVLLGTSLLAASAALGFGQDGVLFTRTYKLGEKVSYTASHGMKDSARAAETLDVDLTVTKALEQGTAELRVHFANVHTSNPDDAGTPDLTVPMAKHNMPTGFSPRDRTAEAALPFLFLAASTVGKPVKVGDEEPMSWQSDLMGFEGSTKVLEITTDQKRLKALIKVKVNIQGNFVGDLTFTSNYDLADGSLIASTGEFVVGSLVQEFKFTRKREGAQ